MRIAGAWIASFVMVVSVSSAQTVTGFTPDVYLITIDTLRADHVHCYGDDQIQTPALDSIAQDGIRFTQAFTPSPITNSAHTSISDRPAAQCPRRYGFRHPPGQDDSNLG